MNHPRSIASIIDRALRLACKLFAILFPFYAFLAALQVLASTPWLQGISVALSGVAHVGAFLLSVYTGFIAIILASKLWLDEEATRQIAEESLSFGLVLRAVLLTLRIFMVTVFGVFCFIIPGVTYFLNRVLSYYILVIEGVSIGQALEKSKKLMSRGRWYQSSSPKMRVTALFIVSGLLGAFAGLVVSGTQIWLQTGTVGQIAVSILMFLGQLFTHFVACFGSLAYAGLYYDLLARYEGADIGSGLQELVRNSTSSG